MAKHLGRVPIAGSVVEAHGLRFEAEAPPGAATASAPCCSPGSSPSSRSGPRAEDEPYPEHHAG